MREIKIPTNVEEARTMAALGFKWLEDNAPEQLTQHWRDMQAEAGRAGYYNGFKDALVIEPPLPPATGTSVTIDIFAYRVEQASRCASNQYAERICNAKDYE